MTTYNYRDFPFVEQCHVWTATAIAKRGLRKFSPHELNEIVGTPSRKSGQ